MGQVSGRPSRIDTMYSSFSPLTPILQLVKSRNMRSVYHSDKKEGGNRLYATRSFRCPRDLRSMRPWSRKSLESQVITIVTLCIIHQDADVFPSEHRKTEARIQYGIAMAEMCLPNCLDHPRYSHDPLPQPGRKNPHVSLPTRPAAVTLPPSLQCIFPRNTKVSPSPPSTQNTKNPSTAPTSSPCPAPGGTPAIACPSA